MADALFEKANIEVKEYHERDVYTHTLSNGLQVLYRHLNYSSVLHAGVMFNIGSRDERVEELGIAHFIEHSVFKGTEKRKAHHILKRVEAVGGRNECLYYSRAYSILLIYSSGSML